MKKPEGRDLTLATDKLLLDIKFRRAYDGTFEELVDRYREALHIRQMAEDSVVRTFEVERDMIDGFIAQFRQQFGAVEDCFVEEEGVALPPIMHTGFKGFSE